MPFSNKSITDFWYYLRNIKNSLDNSEFGILHDLMTRFMVLPHATTSAKIMFSHVNRAPRKSFSAEQNPFGAPQTCKIILK